MKGVQLFVENDAQLWNEEDRGSDERGGLLAEERRVAVRYLPFPCFS